MDNERTPRRGYPWSALAVAVWLYGNAPRFELYPDAGNGHFRPSGIAPADAECGCPGARMRRQMAPMRI